MRHDFKPATVVIQGSSLRYSVTSPAAIVMRSYCSRPFCTAQKDERHLVRAILQKPRDLRILEKSVDNSATCLD